MLRHFACSVASTRFSPFVDLGEEQFLSSATEATLRLMFRDLSSANLGRQNNIRVAFQMQAWRKLS
jgi:hypothetical protein